MKTSRPRWCEGIQGQKYDRRALNEGGWETIVILEA
jgi:hypothetical protein